LLEVVGNAASGSPLQIGFTWVKVGVVLELTVIVMFAVFAHAPAVGVKVYTVVDVLFIAGDHVPVTPLLDVVGKAAKGSPLHIGFTCVNVGLTGGPTVTLKHEGALVPHRFVAVTQILPDDPGVAFIPVVPCPEFIVHPAGTVHVYDAALATAGIEKFSAVATQIGEFPTIAPGWVAGAAWFAGTYEIVIVA
jgi:hypothetical protein